MSEVDLNFKRYFVNEVYFVISIRLYINYWYVRIVLKIQLDIKQCGRSEYYEIF